MGLLGKLKGKLNERFERKQREQQLEQLSKALETLIQKQRRKTPAQKRARLKAKRGRKVHRAQLIARKRRK